MLWNFLKFFTRKGGPPAPALVGWVTLLLVVIGMICAAAGVVAADKKPEWQFFGVMQLVALGALASGFFTGFLFGIPRVLQGNDGSADGARRTYDQRVNTNLEQISDWLTKIIVGVGLVQLNSIPGFLWKASTKLSQAFSSTGAVNQSAAPAVCAAIVFFAVLGILSGYLITRLYFAGVFAQADQREEAARGYSTGRADAMDAPPGTIKSTREPVTLSKESRVVLATLAKYQQELFAQEPGKRWTFTISSSTSQYPEFLRGVSGLLEHGLVSILPENGHVMLSDAGLDYVTQFSTTLGSETYGPFVPDSGKP
jgi:hypothetical protein